MRVEKVGYATIHLESMSELKELKYIVYSFLCDNKNIIDRQAYENAKTFYKVLAGDEEYENETWKDHWH